MTVWRAVTRSVEAQPQNPALCKGFQGMQETGPIRKSEIHRRIPLTLPLLRRKISLLPSERFLKRRGVGTPRRRRKLRFSSRPGCCNLQVPLFLIPVLCYQSRRKIPRAERAMTAICVPDRTKRESHEKISDASWCVGGGYNSPRVWIASPSF